MTISDPILEELKQIFIPREPISWISSKILNELYGKLQNSKNSMLTSGIYPHDSANELSSYIDNWESNDHILAIDFGGTQLKIAIVSIPDFKIIYNDEIGYSTTKVDLNFFENVACWICSHLLDYLSTLNIISEPSIHVATTFSFPLNDNNEIITMGKGFTLSDEIIGENINDILQLSFDKELAKKAQYKFDIQVREIINDSVAVYLTSKFITKNTSFSFILGTGINSCFEIPIAFLPKSKRNIALTNTILHKEDIETSSKLNNTKIIINAEAGFLGSHIIKPTMFDYHNEGHLFDMPLEYVSAGKYLPIVLENILRYYNLILPDTTTEFTGQLFYRIQEGEAKDIIAEQDIVLAQNITKLLIERAAIYIVASLKAINYFIDQNDTKGFKVGFVGSFLAHSEYYKNKITSLSDDQVQMEFLDNSNLIGAAIATYLKRENYHPF